MLKYLIPTVATLGLAAFAAKSHSEAVIVDAPLPDSVEASMGWHLSHEGDMAKLAYGLANSDQIVIMLTCAPGDRAAEAFGVVVPEGAAVSEGPVPVDPLTGLAMSETSVALNSRALTALRQGAPMPVVGEAGRASLPVGGDKAVVDGFFAHCASTPA